MRENAKYEAIMKYIVLHHSATGFNVRDEVLRGWKFYNRIIKSDGRILKQHNTWHYRGKGNESWDICLVGNFEIGEPTQSQIRALEEYLRGKNYPVIGHRDIGKYGFTVGTLNTLCPGKNLYKLINNMTKYIQVINHSSKDVSHILASVRNWYLARGEQISFGGINPWATVDVYKTNYASGGCKNATPYQITWGLGDLDGGRHGKSLEDILIHEIMHCFFFEAGLGDIHDIKTKEYPRGLTGSWANEYNWNYYITHAKEKPMKITEEQLKKLYNLIFKRDPDEGSTGYIEKSLDFVLDEFLKSKEHKAYSKLYQAAKEIEKL